MPFLDFIPEQAFTRAFCPLWLTGPRLRSIPIHKGNNQKKT